MVMSNV